MISALLYLVFHSAKNRWTRQWLRLKQPKYLAGAIVGGLYFYFYFFRYLFQSPGSRHGPPGMSAETLAALEPLAAVLLLVIVLLAWIIPHERAALTFTEAEIAFLFPAPISRRGLIHFKLLRSQFRIFITIFFLTLISNRFGGKAWIHAAGWWLVLSTLNLHLLGSSFARTLLLDRGISNWLRRSVVLGIAGAVAVFIILWIRKTLPPPASLDIDDLDGIRNYFEQVLVSGPIPWLLYPFRVMVRPYFSPDALSFLKALGPAIALLLAHYWWVIRSNVAFEEASAELSEKLAARAAAARSGNWQNSGLRMKKSRAPFRLKSDGFPPVALLWKNLISAGRMITLRLWIMIAAITAVFLLGSGVLSRSGDILSFIGMIATLFLFWSILIGPQVLRQDFRQDLANADVLKMFPLRGWQIVLGELLAPAVILTGIQWLLLILAMNARSSIPELTTALAVTIGVSAALVLPAMNVVMLLIPNAGVLLFPAWFQTGKDAPHGIEATGQRLIMFLGLVIAFIVALIPAAAVFLIVFFVGGSFINPVAMILPAAVLATLTLCGEALLGIALLGQVFDRFDLSAEMAK